MGNIAFPKGSSDGFIQIFFERVPNTKGKNKHEKELNYLMEQETREAYKRKITNKDIMGNSGKRIE